MGESVEGEWEGLVEEWPGVGVGTEWPVYSVCGAVLVNFWT